MTEIYDMSAAMKQSITAVKKGRVPAYPWDSLTVGKSFTVPDNTVQFASLCSSARRYGQRHNKVFKVLHHVDNHIYEVGLIEDNSVKVDIEFKIAPVNDVMKEIK